MWYTFSTAVEISNVCRFLESIILLHLLKILFSLNPWSFVCAYLIWHGWRNACGRRSCWAEICFTILRKVANYKRHSRDDYYRYVVDIHDIARDAQRNHMFIWQMENELVFKQLYNKVNIDEHDSASELFEWKNSFRNNLLDPIYWATQISCCAVCINFARLFRCSQILDSCHNINTTRRILRRWVRRIQCGIENKRLGKRDPGRSCVPWSYITSSNFTTSGSEEKAKADATLRTKKTMPKLRILYSVSKSKGRKRKPKNHEKRKRAKRP